MSVATKKTTAIPVEDNDSGSDTDTGTQSTIKPKAAKGESKEKKKDEDEDEDEDVVATTVVSGEDSDEDDDETIPPQKTPVPWKTIKGVLPARIVQLANASGNSEAETKKITKECLVGPLPRVSLSLSLSLQPPLFFSFV
jgi:hypothetical protein